MDVLPLWLMPWCPPCRQLASHQGVNRGCSGQILPSLPAPQSPSQPAVDLPPSGGLLGLWVNEAHPAQTYVQRQQPLRARSGVSRGHWGSEQLPSAQKLPFLPQEKLRPRVQHLQLRGSGSSHPPHTCTQLVSWPREVVRASMTTRASPDPWAPHPHVLLTLFLPLHLQEPLPAPRPLLQTSRGPAQSQSLCASPEAYCSSHSW